MQIEDLWVSLERSVENLKDQTNRKLKGSIQEISELTADANEVLKVLHQLEWLENNKIEWSQQMEIEEEVEEELVEDQDEEEDQVADEVLEAANELEQQMLASMEMILPKSDESVFPAEEEKVEPIEEKPVVVEDKTSTFSAPQTIAEKLSQSKVEDLTKAFGISEKFLFMNELFEGDSESYKDALNRLNNFPSWVDAEQELLKLSGNYGWDQESEYVNRFIAVVERRYA